MPDFNEAPLTNSMRGFLLEHERAEPVARASSDIDRKEQTKKMQRASNQRRPSTKHERSSGFKTFPGVVVGHTIEDVVRNLIGYGSKPDLLKMLASRARQADAALGTCTDADADLLAMGLLSWTRSNAQAKIHG